MPGNIETTKGRNTNIPEDLGAVIYDITNVLENFGNDSKIKTIKLKQLKQRKEGTLKRIEKLEKLFMVSLNKYEGIIQQKHAIFETNKVHNLKEEIHNLKLENNKLKMQATEWEKNYHEAYGNIK